MLSVHILSPLPSESLLEEPAYLYASGGGVRSNHTNSSPLLHTAAMSVMVKLLQHVLFRMRWPIPAQVHMATVRMG